MIKLKHLSHPRRTLGTFLTGLLLIGWLDDLFATPPVGKSSITVSSQQTLIHVVKGSVSVKVTEAPLEDVLKEIASQSWIRLVLQGSREEKISTQFQGVPLDEALRTLIKENFLLMYAPDKRVEGVVILRASASLRSPSLFPATPAPGQRIAPGESTSPETFILDLYSTDWERRQDAVLVLAERMGERALEAVIRTLREDQDPEVKVGAVWALKDIGGEWAVSVLAETIFVERDSFVRQSAVRALAKVGGPESVEPLTRALREDPDPLVRYEALLELAEIHGEHIPDMLFKALKDTDELISAKAEEFLKR